MAKDFIKIRKDGITRTVRANEIYDWQKRGWLAEGAKKPVDFAAMEKEIKSLTAELDKAKKTIETLTSEKAASTAELDKAKADLAKK